MIIGIEATKTFEKEKTGVGWYCYYITRELVKLCRREHELRLYFNPALISKQLPIANCQLPKYAAIKPLSWPLRKFWTQIRLSLEMANKPPDVLFIPAHLPPLVQPRKMVVTVHDLAFKQYPQVYSKKELHRQEWGIKRVLKRAWRIIVPSEFTKSEIHKYYPNLTRANIFAVPHGVDNNIFQVQNAKLKTQIHNPKLKTVIYIGRLEAKKNIQNLIKAFNIIKSQFPISNLQLLLIGSPGFGYQAIKKEIDVSPYQSDIKELGWLDRDAVVDYLSQAHIFVLPSLYEGFGLPVLEAFACGTPVVCSDIPPLREVGGDVPLYCKPSNPQDIADKIAQLINHEQLRLAKTQAGLRWAQQFTWHAAAQETLEILTT